MSLVVGRLAPSPTGQLHVGHARTFALAWAQVRSRGGRLILRFDDLDASRSRPDHFEAAMRDLEWLGIDWDGPPLRQSEGAEHLRDVARSLVDRGLAFPCTCTRADLQSAVAAPHRGDRQQRYPGTCRSRFSSLAAAREAAGQAALRLRVEAGAIDFLDQVCGPQSEDVSASVGDFPLLNRQGTPSYQFATAVDDAEQGVTDVLRGEDLLASTARQIVVLRALGLPQPEFHHVSLVTDAGGRRLAKRCDDWAISALRERGVDSRRVIGWIGSSADLWTESRADASDLRDAFDVSKLSRGSVRFSMEALGGST